MKKKGVKNYDIHNLYFIMFFLKSLQILTFFQILIMHFNTILKYN